MSVTGPKLQPTLFELSGPGRAAGRRIPAPPADALERIPAAALRESPPALPEVDEASLVRHYVNLSQLNWGVDTGFYPLGSCTMKYNPKVNEWAARLPGFASLHPLAPDETAQGTLELLWELERDLAEISGMDAVTLQPAAGAHGELTGILVVRAYHRARGDLERTEVLIPDSAHGTNPATASMAGFLTVNIPSAPDGGVDLEAFRAALGPRTAAIMITNPSTLGLFERRIVELIEMVHAAGAHLLNDVWGVAPDARLARVAAAHGVPLVVMHNRAEARYVNLVPEVLADLQAALERALAAGVAWDRLIVDPGFGFGKAPRHNLALLRELGAFRLLGRPILLGTSRKSTLGKVLDLPPGERSEATLATTALAVAAGVDMVRVHDVRSNVRAARMADAVMRGWNPEEEG